MEHFVVINDWKRDYEGEVAILGVAHSMEGARLIFDKALISERRYVERNDMDIMEDTNVCFRAECDEEWSGNYTKLYIHKV